VFGFNSHSATYPVLTAQARLNSQAFLNSRADQHGKPWRHRTFPAFSSRRAASMPSSDDVAAISICQPTLLEFVNSGPARRHSKSSRAIHLGHAQSRSRISTAARACPIALVRDLRFSKARPRARGVIARSEPLLRARACSMSPRFDVRPDCARSLVRYPERRSAPRTHMVFVSTVTGAVHLVDAGFGWVVLTGHFA